MIIRARMPIISEYCNNKRETLYNLKASLTSLLTANAWGIVPHGMWIRVRVQQYSERTVNNNDPRNRNGIACRGKQWQGRQWREIHLWFLYDERIKHNQQGQRTWTRRLYCKRCSTGTLPTRRTLQLPSIHIIYQKLQGIIWGFWRGIREHFWEKISQGLSQEVQ